MPLLRVPGQGTEILEAAVINAEADRYKVVQVVGNMAGAWWLLVEKPAAAARKAAVKSGSVKESRS